MYVYGDLILVLNLVMNSMIFVLTAWAAGINYKVWKIMLAAAAGGVYALGSLGAGETALYHPLAKLAVSVALVTVAYGVKPLRTLAALTAYFYVVSLLFGGAVVGWLFLAGSGWQPGEALRAVTWLDLGIGSMAGLLLVFLVSRRVLANMSRRRQLLPVTVNYAGRQVGLTALLDTGNALYTAGQKPVVLVDRQALGPVLGSQAGRYLEETAAGEWLTRLEECRDEAWLSRIQVIPCRSVGGRSLLLGFRPDGDRKSVV